MPSWNPLPFAFALWCAAGPWFSPPCFAQSSWQLSSRLQAGAEYDNNIYETSARHVAATCGRLLIQTRAEKIMARNRVDLDYTGALQIYPHDRNENKLLQDLKAGLLWQAAERFRLFARGQATLKLYPDNVTDYGTATGLAGVAVALAPRVSFEVAAETGQLDYAVGDEFDFAFKGAWLVLRFRQGGNLLWEAAAFHRQATYPHRYAVTEFGVLLPSPQNDALATFRLGASLGRKYFLHARLEAQRNSSNRDLFDYNRAQLHFLFGFNPAPRWLLRTAILLQRKQYRMASLPAPLPELDPEREQSNQLAIDLSRNFSSEASWMLRLSYHNNETPVRGLFYRKMLLFTGFEVRL